MQSVIKALDTDWSHCFSYETLGLETSQVVG